MTASPPTGDLLSDFVAALPKVELHVHLVGSAAPGTVVELAGRYPEAGVPVDLVALQDFYRFRDFPHFIEVYKAVAALVRDADDIRTLVVGLARDLAACNVRHAEVKVSPFLHVPGTMAAADLRAGLDEGRAAAGELGVGLAWCMDIPGEFGQRAGELTLDFALHHAPDGLVSFDLAGPERGVPRADFADVFARARAAGLHSVPHAGETTGPATIWSALRDLGAERIGHGTSATADAELVDYLGEHQVPLEVCPTSNLRTGQVASLEAHPVRDMLERSLNVTLSTDDPPMFGTTLDAEYLAVARIAGLDRAALARLAHNAVAASFLDSAARSGLHTEIDDVARAHTDGLTDTTRGSP